MPGRIEKLWKSVKGFFRSIGEGIKKIGKRAGTSVKKRNWELLLYNKKVNGLARWCRKGKGSERVVDLEIECLSPRDVHKLNDDNIIGFPYLRNVKIKNLCCSEDGYYGFGNMFREEGTLKSVKIGTADGIPANMFKGCVNLESIVIDKLTGEIGDNAFGDNYDWCDKLEVFEIKDGSGINEIGSYSLHFGPSIKKFSVGGREGRAPITCRNCRSVLIHGKIDESIRERIDSCFRSVRYRYED